MLRTKIEALEDLETKPDLIVFPKHVMIPLQDIKYPSNLIYFRIKKTLECSIDASIRIDIHRYISSSYKHIRDRPSLRRPDT